MWINHNLLIPGPVRRTTSGVGRRPACRVLSGAALVWWVRILCLGHCPTKMSGGGRSVYSLVLLETVWLSDSPVTGAEWIQITQVHVPIPLHFGNNSLPKPALCVEHNLLLLDTAVHIMSLCSRRDMLCNFHAMLDNFVCMCTRLHSSLFNSNRPQFGFGLFLFELNFYLKSENSSSPTNFKYNFNFISNQECLDISFLEGGKGDKNREKFFRFFPL